MTAKTKVERHTEHLIHICHAAAITDQCRVVMLGTHDRDAALTLVETVAEAQTIVLHHVTPAGVRRFQASAWAWEELDTRERTPEEMLDEAQRHGGMVILEEFVAHIGVNQPKARVKLASMLGRSYNKKGLVLVLIDAPGAQCELPATLSAQAVTLQFGLPSQEELLALVRSTVAAYAQRAQLHLDVETIRAMSAPLATGLAGLTRKAAQDALNDALAAHGAALNAAASLLEYNKAQRLAQQLGMEIVNPAPADVDMPVGMENVHRFLDINRQRIRKRGRDRCKGIILLGPPGTGKTMYAKFISAKLNMPMVVLRISSLMNSYVGETEKLFSKAMETIEVLTPCVLFVDELEKLFGETAERDGGTMMRATGMLLGWMSDNEFPSFIVATSNDIKRMSELGMTMTRSGRIDKIFMVDVPTQQAREQILHGALTGTTEAAARFAKALATETEYFSGADLFSIVKQAAAVAAYQQVPLTLDLLRQEVAGKRARVHALYEEFDGLRRWGAIHAEPAAA